MEQTETTVYTGELFQVCLHDMDFVSYFLVIENIVYSGCSFSRGDYQLPASSTGCEVFPASQVAVYGTG